VLFAAFKYLFYVTNDFEFSADEVIAGARGRCDKENLIGQLKDIRALHAPVNTLEANLAYMTMASLAWTLKAWCALLPPVSPRWAEATPPAPTTADDGVPDLPPGIRGNPVPDRGQRAYRSACAYWPGTRGSVRF
jgi:hypothetical protein